MYMVDLVNGDRFEEICDFHLGSPIPDGPSPLLYADMDNYKGAIDFIRDNPGRRFKLLTHNGDSVIEECHIPPNLLSWYTVNVNFQHPRVHSIPIGLERPKWHPLKISIMENAENYDGRVIKAIGEFNPMTFYIERVPLANLILTDKIHAKYESSVNGRGFHKYVDNLRKYAFCLCPRGNGIDTHRIWEALYLGSIPIIKRHITHECLKNMPVLFIDDWSEITEERLREEYNIINSQGFSYNELSFSYWKDKVLQ